MAPDQERRLQAKLEELDARTQHAPDERERETAFTLAMILRLYIDLRDSMPGMIANAVATCTGRQQHRDMQGAPLSDRVVEWVKTLIVRDPKLAVILVLVVSPYLPVVGPWVQRTFMAPAARPAIERALEDWAATAGTNEVAVLNTGG